MAFTGGLAPRDVVDCVVVAEQLGYESAWVAEGHGGDQFAILAACAAATRRIRLATGISSVFVRSAPTVAMAAATVDDLAGGRLLLGLGSSHRVQVEDEHGIPFVEPTRRLRETVDVVRALLRDGAVSYRGEVVSISRFELWFTPVRRTLPIYVAALFPPLLEVCGEIADGALLTWTTTDAVRRARDHVARGARRADRAPEAVDLASFLPCVVAPTRAEALDRLRPVVAFYAGFFPRYNRRFAEAGFATAAHAAKAAWDRGDREAAARQVPDELIEAVALTGPGAACRARIDAYRRAGLDLPIVSPRAVGSEGRQAVLDALHACAP